MKIVVVGGSGLIGSKLVNKFRKQGHEVVSASPDSGVNTITGEGLCDALKDADVVVDVSNSPSLEGSVALKFFETSTRNILRWNKQQQYNITLLSPLLVLIVYLNSVTIAQRLLRRS